METNQPTHQDTLERKPSWITYRRIIVLLAALSALPILLSSSFWTQVPGRDSGVFLYVGSAILRGDVPYRDVWDHKGPVIYFINALGLGLGGGTQWGVRLLEWVSLLLATFVGYDLMKRAFGVFPALFGSVIWVFTLLVVLEGGNLTEEYALPLQFGALWLFATSPEDDKGFFRWFSIGLAGSLAFLLRQNLTGIWVSLAFYMIVQVISRRKPSILLRRLPSLLLGVSLPVIAAVLYFSAQSALPAFWDEFFLYNLTYSRTALSDRLSALLAGIGITSMTGLFLLAFAGWVLIIAHSRRPTTEALSTARGSRRITGLLIIMLPIELLFGSLSGNVFPHYFITWLPTLVLLAAFAMSELPSTRKTSSGSLFSLRPLSVILLGAVCIGFTARAIKDIVSSTSEPDIVRQTAQYVLSSTSETDPVLIWGASTAVNYMTGRVSPTLYEYQLPLYNSAYSNADKLDRFLQDITEGRPKLIIDASDDVWNVPGRVSLDSILTGKEPDPGSMNAGFDKVVAYVAAHYCLATR
ncbi:MAG TPA: glycosyltransferase family 39 protein, partial [Chloroflexia bacterium]|nr:glycosyltransferase family 39 protein [Chloroflexia bacterium]